MNIILKVVFTLIFTLLSGLFTSAQNHLTYVEGKEQYRVIAIKNDTNHIESISNISELKKPTRIYFPNAFTPDEDGLNDRFGAIGENIEDYNLKVFNRWGEVIFETNRLDLKWDGTHGGQKAPEGVYVYTVTATESTTGNSFSKTGTVTLLL